MAEAINKCKKHKEDDPKSLTKEAHCLDLESKKCIEIKLIEAKSSLKIRTLLFWSIFIKHAHAHAR